MNNNDSLGALSSEGSYVMYTASAIVYGSVVALGLPLNAVSLWVLLRRHGLKSSSAVFMSHLALSDLLLVLSLPTRVYFYATGTWPLGIQACTATTMLFRNNIRSSAIFITFIGLDRLLAVVYPLRSRSFRTTTNAWKACVFIWLLIVAVNIPESLYQISQMQSCNATNVCFEFTNYVCSVANPIVGYVQSGLVFAMLGVNVVATSMVSWKLRGHLSDAARVNKMNVMLIFTMNLLMFIVFFLPFSIVLTLKIKKAIMPMFCLASVNCCLDPLLYYFSLDAFWKKKEGSDMDFSDQIT
ncbi:lysophosphatidic acid receptor 4-like [Salmo trutta]|uniref:lysophosphatidic acid receptor 4-like n=1 Tax=Salmo trutta TaxID=8032 RepID=UPI001130A410|nr:lysophosphatidic acid receptor 4-like [Salmo trutta]